MPNAVKNRRTTPDAANQRSVAISNMQTIGERLEEARKRRGISIREASEATKIRSEYLTNFENNSFEINLPEIYVRGFLRSYGNYLKLNPDKLITDYNAHRLGESKFVRRENGRELLGRMDAPEPRGEEQREPEGPSRPTSFRQEMEGDSTRFEENSTDRTDLIKLGTVIGGAAVLVALIIFLAFSIIRGGSDTPATAEETTRSAPGPQVSSLVITADGGDIQAISVTDTANNQLLFRGPLARGQQERFEISGQVRIASTDTQYIRLELDGSRSRPRDASGPGQFLFP